MEIKSEYTLEELNEAVEVISDFPITRNPQKIEKIIPVVLYLLQARIKSITEAEGKKKYYAPVWVAHLLYRLSTSEKPLSDDEYAVFRTKTENLSFDDFKPARDGLFGYEPKYALPDEIHGVIMALKSYFDLI